MKVRTCIILFLRRSCAWNMPLVLLVILLTTNGCLTPAAGQSATSPTPDERAGPSSEPDTAVGRGDSTIEPPINVGREVVFDGTIVGILESYPLTLQVRDATGEEYYVGLSVDTKITRNGETLDMGELSTEMRVHIEGTITSAFGAKATTIKVLP